MHRFNMTAAVLVAAIFAAAPASADDTLQSLLPPGYATTVFTLQPGNSVTLSGQGTTNGLSANCCANINTGLTSGQFASNTYATRSVLRFPDVASVIGQQQIVSATLSLYRTSLGAHASTVTNVRRLNSPFVNVVSGTGANASVPNGVLNSSISNDADNAALFGSILTPAATQLGTLPAAGVNQYVSLDVTSTVQAWQASNYTNNYGFGIMGFEVNGNIGATGSASSFQGLLGPNVPILTVQYIAPLTPEPGSIALWGGVGAALAFGAWRRRKAHEG